MDAYRERFGPEVGGRRLLDRFYALVGRYRLEVVNEVCWVSRQVLIRPRITGRLPAGTRNVRGRRLAAAGRAVRHVERGGRHGGQPLRADRVQGLPAVSPGLRVYGHKRMLAELWAHEA